ncbi:helix-turn-helix domain-containing protein [Actinoplanes sp. M2I2]|uniref:winged helix-turn-helix transcriptional regulator n=1 Tax=Actinoplanes sp. M2I2 TaxID=1734444 RepID=UPI00202150C0|nr:helix-turn-helix domain-containing protein [Actinoplanes sp. M2I2]
MQSVFDLLARRWTGDILVAGVEGARRFREYRRAVAGVSDRMLVQRLRELESLGLVSRTVVPSSPVQVFYAPTQHAIDLMRAVQPLVSWGRHHRAKAEAHAHAPAS